VATATDGSWLAADGGSQNRLFPFLSALILSGGLAAKSEVWCPGYMLISANPQHGVSGYERYGSIAGVP